MNGEEESNSPSPRWGSPPGGRASPSERMRGIEPPPEAWEASVLPLNYIRSGQPPILVARPRSGNAAGRPGSGPGARLLGDHVLEDLGEVPHLDVAIGTPLGDAVPEHD